MGCAEEHCWSSPSHPSHALGAGEQQGSGVLLTPSPKSSKEADPIGPHPPSQIQATTLPYPWGVQSSVEKAPNNRRPQRKRIISILGICFQHESA